jgi:hypothetical protein
MSSGALTTAVYPLLVPVSLPALQRLQQYKSIFATSYTAALKQPVLESSISAITCGGTLIYKANTAAAAAAGTAPVPATASDAPTGTLEVATAPAEPSATAAAIDIQDSGTTAATAGAMPARTLLALARIHQAKSTPQTILPTQPSLLQQQQQRKNVLALVEIITRFSMPAPATHYDRARIAETVVTGSSGILSGPMSEFFKVPSALMNFVPWSHNADSQEAAHMPTASRARAAVPVIKPTVSYNEAPTCLFPLTRSNSMADDQGRFWSLMDGKECVFRPAAAAIPRPVARSVSWQDAPACVEQPNESNSVADNNGRLWGWQEGESCAFKSESAAQGVTSGDAARVATGDAASKVSVVWGAAPSCSFSPKQGNAVPGGLGLQHCSRS